MPDMTQYQFRRRPGFNPPRYEVQIDGVTIGDVWRIRVGFWRGRTYQGDPVPGGLRSRREAAEGLCETIAARQGSVQLGGYSYRPVLP